jgi:hypothetical protein
MAASAGRFYLPSKEELGITQFETTALEKEMDTQKVIGQSQLPLDELTNQLNERKSKISPAGEASFDILSLIFERCSEVDWKSPLSFGAVSRHWRDVILHTPRAWCFIDISSLNEAAVHAYLERSGQRELHVAFSDHDNVELLAPVAHRIQCLATPILRTHLADLTFPRLTRLRSSLSFDFDLHVNPNVITPSRFPSLRHLEIRGDMFAVVNCETLPSMQTLKPTVFDNGWRELLTSCKGTLVSLQIMRAVGRDAPQVPHMELPKLRYLKVVDESRNDCSWASPLDTPALRVYWEESNCRRVVKEPRECTESITHLRLERVPSMFPKQLRVLQLDLSIAEFRSLVSDLKNRLSLCPHLEIIEFGRTYVTTHEVAEMETTLDQWDRQLAPEWVRPPTITANWTVCLPDEIEAEVRYCHV